MNGRLQRVQGLRRSGAAGPHRNDRPRGEVERVEIEDQLDDLDDGVAELLSD